MLKTFAIVMTLTLLFLGASAWMYMNSIKDMLPVQATVSKVRLEGKSTYVKIKYVVDGKTYYHAQNVTYPLWNQSPLVPDQTVMVRVKADKPGYCIATDLDWLMAQAAIPVLIALPLALSLRLIFGRYLRKFKPAKKTKSLPSAM